MGRKGKYEIFKDLFFLKEILILCKVVETFPYSKTGTALFPKFKQMLKKEKSDLQLNEMDLFEKVQDVIDKLHAKAVKKWHMYNIPDFYANNGE